jgi:hypothetical protein
MEVLKEGQVPAPELWCEEVVCGAKDKHDQEGCGAVLKVAVSDLILRYWKGSHFNHYYTAVQCPRCLKYNRVHPPKAVWLPLHTEENKAKASFDGFSDR